MGRVGELGPLGVMKQLLGIVILALACEGARAGSTNTSDWDFGPFLKGKPWPSVPTVAYVESRSNVWVHPTNPKNHASVQERLEDEAADFATVVLCLPDSRTFKTYNAFVLGPYLCAVYSGDFNNDGIPDFLAVKPSGGNGIGCWDYLGVFALSQGKDYRFTRVSSWGLGPQSLALDPATKTFRFIHTAFRQGKGVDGRVHSFWVHRFFRWNGVGFELDSNLSPIWIQFLGRPNHEPTTLLTPKLKAETWANDWRFQSNIEW